MKIEEENKTLKEKERVVTRAHSGHTGTPAETDRARPKSNDE
jgi:hypothetical protein